MIDSSRYSWHMSDEDAGLTALKRAVSEHRSSVVSHPIYSELRTSDDLRTFMERHVFAVWDFMTLLTALQRRFTCVDLPWRPRGEPIARRLVNEIMLIEESDRIGSEHISHFELYLGAMEDVGADTTAIRRFIADVEEGHDVPVALRNACVPDAVARFVGVTWELATEAPDHAVAAVFALTREDLIPDMFERVVGGCENDPRLRRFLTYLERHIVVDAEEHTPMAMALLQILCRDRAHWEDCEKAVTRCLDARDRLWTDVYDTIVARRELVAS